MFCTVRFDMCDHGSRIHLLSLQNNPIPIVRHVVFFLSPRTRTGTLSSLFPESVFQHSEQPCEDQRPQQSGALTQLQPLTEIDMGRKPRDLLDPASTNPVQLTSTPNKQDLLNEEIQKLAEKTHLEVQQREDIRRDLAEQMKFVPPDPSCRRTCVLLERRSGQG